MLKNAYLLERKSVQKMAGFVMNWCRKRKTRTKTVLSFVNGYFHLTMWYKGGGGVFNIAVDKNID